MVQKLLNYPMVLSAFKNVKIVFYEYRNIFILEYNLIIML